LIAQHFVFSQQNAAVVHLAQVGIPALIKRKQHD